jgi:hypothetical protein
LHVFLCSITIHKCLAGICILFLFYNLAHGGILSSTWLDGCAWDD